MSSFGLFKSLTSESMIKNLNLKVKNVTASSAAYVGTIAGVLENSKLVNINLISSSGVTLNAKVIGKKYC